ncbi:MAG: hypothetical protein HY671_10300 [Chloroflexi bacterium]|nr:hypothetical protein [Chloroflexota bacterium]
MTEIVTKLRYNPDDSLKDIELSTLDQVARKHGVKITSEERTGKGRVYAGQTVFEETWEVPFEQVSQTIVTVSAGDKESIRKALRDLVKLYRSPVPIWGFMGSTKEGEEIARQVIEENDGW